MTSSSFIISDSNKSTLSSVSSSKTNPSKNHNNRSSSFHSSRKLEVPTLLSAKPDKYVTIQLHRTSEPDDLKSIKQRDAFLYYSIPEVRRTQVMMKPGAEPAVAEVEVTPRTQVVRRSSRMSFECHPDLLMEDLLLDGLDDNDENDLFHFDI